MGFIVFLFIVGFVYLIIFAVKNHKKRTKEQETEKLKTTPAYEVALQIKDKLQGEGYHIGDLNVWAVNSSTWGECAARFAIYDQAKTSIGHIDMFTTTRGTRTAMHNVIRYCLIMEDMSFFAICCENTGIYVESNKNITKIPEFMKIVTQVIKNSKYEFKHPHAYYEYPELKKFLNVMF